MLLVSIIDGEKGVDLMLKLAVCVSGGGTNLQAIIDAIEAGRIHDTEISAGHQQQSKCLCLGTCEKGWY